jgi:S1-C subfamily serine protease
MKPSRDLTGSGFAIKDDKGNPYIITNAHIVSNPTLISVRKFGSSVKYIAKVHFTGHDCDVAILKIEDPSFWDGVPFFKFGSLPVIYLIYTYFTV